MTIFRNLMLKNHLRERLVRHELVRPFVKLKNFSLRRYPRVPTLQLKHVQNCRILPNRIHLLRTLPKQAICIEPGVLYGDFSQRIREECDPKELHLVDLDLTKPLSRFAAQIQRNQVVPRQGFSWDVLDRYPDEHFDWIYIDASHDYEEVRKDISVAKNKVKADGTLVFNDYQYLCPDSYKKFGVVEAVNELCITDDWKLLFFCLEGRGFCDVAVRRLPRSPAASPRG